MSDVTLVGVSGLGFWCKTTEMTEAGQQLGPKAAAFRNSEPFSPETIFDIDPKDLPSAPTRRGVGGAHGLPAKGTGSREVTTHPV